MARRFVVRGSGNFPLLMLHIARCYPATPADAERLSYAMPTQAREQSIMLLTNIPISVHASLWKEANWPIVSII
jgi:hypothetical protein